MYISICTLHIYTYIIYVYYIYIYNMKKKKNHEKYTRETTDYRLYQI